MSDWQSVCIGDIANIPKKQPIANPQAIELLTVRLHAKGVERTGKYPRATEKSRPYFAREAGEILIGRQNFHNGGIGIVSNADNGLICSNAITSLIPTDRAYKEFLFYLLSSPEFRKSIQRQSEGTGQSEISETKILSLEIELPPLAEQKKIADILSAIDDMINRLHEQLAKTRYLMHSILGDLISGKITSCGYKESEHGRIPANWEVKKLDECLDLCDLKSNTDGEYEVFTSSSKGLMRQSEYYGANRITRRDSTGFNVIPNNYITYRSRSDSNSFYFNLNDFAVTGLVSKYYPVFRPKDKQSSAFFCLLLNHYSQLLSTESVGTSQLVLSYNALKKVALPIPPTKDQHQICDTVTSFKELLKKQEHRLASVNELKKSISADLLSGRQRVSI